MASNFSNTLGNSSNSGLLSQLKAAAGGKAATVPIQFGTQTSTPPTVPYSSGGRNLLGNVPYGADPSTTVTPQATSSVQSPFGGSGFQIPQVNPQAQTPAPVAPVATPQTSQTPIAPPSGALAAAGAAPTTSNSSTGLYGQFVQQGMNNYNKFVGQLSPDFLSNYDKLQRAINLNPGGLQPATTGVSQAVAEANAPALALETAALTAQPGIAAEAAPVSQFGVQTSPVTGLPISPGQTAGSAAFSGGQTQQQQSQGATYQGYQAAAASAKNLQTQLNNLITNAGINPSDVNLLNSGIQKIAANVSDPNYKTFTNLLTDLASVYSQILTPPGSSPTDYQTTLAQGLLDSSQKGSGISDVIKNLDAQVEAKMAGTYSAGTGTSNPSLNAASTNAVAPAGFGWNP